MDRIVRRLRPETALALPVAALTALIFALAMIDVAMGLRGWRNSIQWHTWFNVAQGTSAALAIYAGTWIVWGTGRLTTRLALSAAAVIVVLFVWQVQFRASRSPWLKLEQQFLAATIWLLSIGLVAAAWRFGIRVVDHQGQIVNADPRSRQMSLLGLLALMSGAAIVLAGVRQILPRELGEWSITGDDVFAILAQLSGTMLVASTVITCFHVPRRRWLNLALAAGFMVVIGVLHVVAYGQSYRLSVLPLDPRVAVKGIYFAVLSAWLLAAAGALHLCGLRLRRCAPWGRVLPLPAAS